MKNSFKDILHGHTIDVDDDFMVAKLWTAMMVVGAIIVFVVL